MNTSTALLLLPHVEASTLVVVPAFDEMAVEMFEQGVYLVFLVFLGERKGP